MEFTEAEKQILIAIDWLSRRKPPDRALIESKKQSLFSRTLVDWQNGMDDLITNGSVIETDGRLFVSDHIRGQVAKAVSDWLAEGFNETLLKSEKSSAYSRFCQLVYGQDLCQYSMMDMRQLEDLLDILSLNAENHVVDLGCALGIIDEYISDKTGARVTGIDFAAKVISRANERTTDKRDRLEFEVQHMDALSLEPSCFDAVISVDSLYFVRDLIPLLGRCRQFCKPDGQFGFFYSQVINEKDSREMLDSNGTKLARALQELDISYGTRDYTEDEHRHWKLCRKVAEELKAEFEAEGRADLYESRAQESDVLIEVIKDNRVRRYLYYGTFASAR